MDKEQLEMCIYEDLDNLVIQSEHSKDTAIVSDFLTTDELAQVVDCILETITKWDYDDIGTSACINDDELGTNKQ